MKLQFFTLLLLSFMPYSFLPAAVNGPIFGDVNNPNVKKFIKTGECNGCDLSFIDLSRGILRQAKENNPGKKIQLRNANLTNSSFKENNVSEVDFTGANLTDATFQWANLKNAIFTKATLDRTNFHGADAQHAVFDGANGGAYFGGADLSNASFIGAVVSSAQFNRTNLNNANFNSATINPDKFYQAKNIMYADFSNTALQSPFNIKALWHAWIKHKFK